MAASTPAVGSNRVLPFSVGQWRVEPDACRLSTKGDTVHIRPQLMELLVFLAGHAADVALKDEILERVWNGRFVSESCLTKSIAQLREALGGEPHDRHYIETIPKRGYRLVAPIQPMPEAGPRGAVLRQAGRTAWPLTAAVACGLAMGLALGWCLSSSRRSS